jgi:hypothetical protein
MQPYRTVVADSGSSPTSSGLLTDLDMVKLELGLTDTVDPDRDDWLETVIAAASKSISSAANRKFTLDSITDYFRDPVSWTNYGSWRGFGQYPPLILSTTPVVAISSITEGGSPLDSSAYEFDSGTGQVWRVSGSGRCAWGSQQTIVTYDAGYAGGAIPADLQRAATLLVANAYSSKGRDRTLRAENIPGVAEYTYWVGAVGDTALPPEVDALVRPYKNPAYA